MSAQTERTCFVASYVTNKAKHACFKEYAPQMNFSIESTQDVINYQNGKTVSSIREKTQVKVKTVLVLSWLR